MRQSPSGNSRFWLARDRWTRLTVAAAAALAVGSLIARRAAASAGQSASRAADTDLSDAAEPVAPAGQALGQAFTVRLRSAWTAAAGRLSAVGRAAWRELLHPDHSERSGPDPVPLPGDAGAEGETDTRHDSAAAEQTRTP